MPEYLGRPVIFVGADIVKAARIRHPYQTAIGVADDFRPVLRLCGIKVADFDRIQLRARLVGAPGKLAMIRRMDGSPDVEKALALAKRVAVEESFRRAPGVRDPAKDRILSPYIVAAIVEPWPILPGNFGIVFLDPTTHLLENLRPQFCGRRQHCPGITVFRLEHGPDFAGERGGIAQNLLPVGSLEPSIVVAERESVQICGRRTLFNRKRRLFVRHRPMKLAHSSLLIENTVASAADSKQGAVAVALLLRDSFFSTFFLFNSIKCSVATCVISGLHLKRPEVLES